MSTRKTSGTPDDQPFDFNLDAVEAEANATAWRMHAHGRRWTLEHMAELDVWAMLDGANRGDLDAMVAILSQAFGDDWNEFRSHKLPRHKLQALFNAYTKHCGADMGESQASTGS
jgi:hypothetical protein